MNHIYRSLWNATLGCWVAAPETASAVAGKGHVRGAVKWQVGSNAPQTFLATVAGSIALWLGSALPAVGQNILLAPGQTQNTSADFTAPVYVEISLPIMGTLNHDSGNSLTISTSIWVSGDSSLNILGTSSLINYGLMSSYGALTNSGTLTNQNILWNHGVLTNSGTLTNQDTLDNQGILTNSAGATLNNNSIMTNLTVLNNHGTLNNSAGSTLDNLGFLENSGMLNNSAGSTLNNLGVLENSGTLINDGTLFSPGVFSMNSGALINNGSLQYTGVLGGRVSGVGSFTGDIALNSTSVLTAGNASTPYGTLTVNGNLTFDTNSVLQVKVDPLSGNASKVLVTGNANLAGSVVHVGTESNAATDFQVGKTYTILTASAINGTFNGATSNFAYLNANLGYGTANAVTLTLERKSSGGGNMQFADLANTSNQSSTANAIEGLPTNSALYQYVQALPAGAPAAVFSSLSGDTHASVNSAMGMLGAQAPGISQNHLRSNLTAGLRAGAPVAQSSGTLPASALPSSKALPAWVEVVGNWQRFNGNGNAPGLKQNTAGLFLGGDEEVGSSGWRVGGSVGYTQSDAKVSSRDASADISSYSAAVYAGKGFTHGANRVNVLGGLAYTHHSIESERTVASLGQNLKADYSGHTAQLFAEVGYAMGQYDKQGLEPFVGITLGEQRTGSFQETGGFAALSSQSSSDTLASTTLGVRAHSDFKLAGKDTRVKASLGVRHAWGGLSQNRTMAFEGSSSFTVAGAPLARNTALVGLQAEMELSRRAALVLGYNGEFGSGNRDHSANVKLRWAY